MPGSWRSRTLVEAPRKLPLRSPFPLQQTRLTTPESVSGNPPKGYSDPGRLARGNYPTCTYCVSRRASREIHVGALDSSVEIGVVCLGGGELAVQERVRRHVRRTRCGRGVPNVPYGRRCSSLARDSGANRARRGRPSQGVRHIRWTRRVTRRSLRCDGFPASTTLRHGAHRLRCLEAWYVAPG